ncbi:Nn.00g095250.m01.CDS01 [Neocucurbitaria sp. VM-36]
MPSPPTNTAWTIPSTASAVIHLSKQSKPIPTPGPSQVLVKLTAASLNFRDVLISIRSPQYPGSHKADLVPGSDGAGTICSIGENSKWSGKQGLKIAAALGATVIATSSSDSKLDFAKSLGATHVVNYSKIPEWDQEVLRITGGKGVDHVIETGGAGTLMKSINSTRMGGLVSVLGILTPNAPIDAAFVPSVLFGAKIVKGCTAFSRDLVAELAKFVEANDIKPVVAQEFEFERMVEAFEALQKQSAVGKIAVRISEA